MARCWDELDPPLRDALEAAAERLRGFHELQVDVRPRGEPRLCLRPEPLRRAGCYVPGGRAAYPSTVLMSVIPAQVAGVESIAHGQPGRPGRRRPPARRRRGAPARRQRGPRRRRRAGDRRAGLRHRDASQPVDKVVGPGQHLRHPRQARGVRGRRHRPARRAQRDHGGRVRAGADPAHIAADLVSQLEHDPLAWAVCVTDSPQLAEAVATELRAAPRRRRHGRGSSPSRPGGTGRW